MPKLNLFNLIVVFSLCLNLGGCIWPGVRIDQPPIEGMVYGELEKGESLVSVGFDLDKESACHNPRRSATLVPGEKFQVESVKRLQLLILPFFHTYHTVFGCFNSDAGSQLFWQNGVINTDAGFMSGYKFYLQCEVSWEGFYCEDEYKPFDDP